MPFGRPSRFNNRSQHALVDQAGTSAAPIATGISNNNSESVGAPAGGTISSISPFPVVSSTGGQQSANVPQPSSHHYPASGITTLPAHNHSLGNIATSVKQEQLQQHHLPLHPQDGSNNGVSVPADKKLRKAARDFADAVSKSQSQHQLQQIAPPSQSQHSTTYGVDPSNSHELLLSTHRQIQTGAHTGYPQQQQQQQYVPSPTTASPQVEVKQSKSKRLIKSFLGGTTATAQRSSDIQSHDSHNAYDNSSGVARQPSHRASVLPTLRTGPSQVSLTQHTADWNPQSSLQASPVHGIAASPHPPTLRRVDTTESPYTDDGNHHLQHDSRSTLDRQSSYDSPRQFGAPSPQDRYSSTPTHHSSHLSSDSQQNSRSNLHVSRESLLTDADHSSSASVLDGVQQTEPLHPPPRRSSSLTPQPRSKAQVEGEVASQSQNDIPGMAPAPIGLAPGRRSQETDSHNSQGPPPAYRHVQQATTSMPPPGQQQQQQQQQQQLPPQGAINYNRQSTIQERQMDPQLDQGRHSPQPPEDEKAFKELLTKYKNVKRLYFDGKTQIDQLNQQVEQLQNAVANQRMSQSRTALDDSEYMTRFTRLNGAINNLSFNIRKDWVRLPGWLQDFVSQDCLKTGKQEMTAIGRAVITRWVVEEIFDACFHPGLDQDLSRRLKEIEQNIRRHSHALNSREEYDALTTKVVNWRMATLEGLSRELASPESTNHRAEYTKQATSDLTAELLQYLVDPPPAGVEGSASMIVELAIGIASNIPLESRDVAIIYPLPGEPVDTKFMEPEKTPLPALEMREDTPEGDVHGEDGGDQDGSSRPERNGSHAAPPSSSGGGGGGAGGLKERSKSRAGMAASAASSTLQNMLGNASRQGSVASVSHQQHLQPDRKPSSTPSRNNSVANVIGVASGIGGGNVVGGVSGLQQQQQQQQHQQEPVAKVRFAGFMAVDVRGRQVLVKAPVWTL